MKDKDVMLLRVGACREAVQARDGRQCSPSALHHLDLVVGRVLVEAERLAEEEGRRRVDHFHVRRALRQLYK